MFNPKENLLDQQLAVSGLEMNILGVLAGVSAVASIAGGISASNQAKKNNRQNAKSHAAQKKAAAKQARRTNKYNKKVFEADKENYYNNRAYEWETSLRNWQYNQDMQDYQYMQAAQQYLGAVENADTQLTYNSMAAMEALESEQASLNEIMAEDAFKQEGLLIESLQAEGKASMVQAGNSRAKAMQSAAAQTGRERAVMNASMISARAQSARNMRDIVIQKFQDDQNVMSSLMIRPEKLPSLPKPIQTPERIFVEPMQVDPQYIAPPLKQNTFAPLVQGIGSAAMSVAKIGTMGDNPFIT
tara:strand:- start:9388 stop:10290 length:903 start_codon:yes stop_codon:yes gene_type:complete